MEAEASFFLVLAFKSTSFLGRLVLAFNTMSCSVFFRIPTSSFFLSCCCCTVRAFLGAIVQLPFLGPGSELRPPPPPCSLLAFVPGTCAAPAL